MEFGLFKTQRNFRKILFLRVRWRNIVLKFLENSTRKGNTRLKNRIDLEQALQGWRKLSVIMTLTSFFTGHKVDYTSSETLQFDHKCKEEDERK